MVIAAIGATAAVASAANSIASSSKQSGAVSGNQTQVQNQLMNLQPQFDTALATETGAYAPYSTSGVAAQGNQADLLGLNGQPAADAAMAKFQSSPGYQFQLTQGLRGVDAGAAAAGMLRSGATLKAEDTFAQGLADTDFGNYYNRLSGLASGGLTAAGGLQTANQDYVANMAGNVQQQNTASTGATTAQNSILGNTGSGLATTANSLFSNPNVQTALNKLFPGSNTTSAAAFNANPAIGLNPTPGTSFGYDGTFQSGGVF